MLFYDFQLLVTISHRHKDSLVKLIPSKSKFQMKAQHIPFADVFIIQ